jgi:hypothetical protein
MIGSNYNQTLFERSVSLYYKVSEIAQLNFSGGEFVISVIVSVCTIVSVWFSKLTACSNRLR